MGWSYKLRRVSPQILLLHIFKKISPTTKFKRSIGYSTKISQWETIIINMTPSIREAKFKRALRVHFLTHYTKNFCRFRTPKVKSGSHMINPSIESSDFLFWHKKILSRIFENFVGNRQSTFHEFKFNVCLHTPKISKYEI